MRIPQRIAVLIALVFVHSVSAPAARAEGGDAGLFSAGGGAPPNILLLLDSSGSMGKAPSNLGTCTTDCRKRDMANRAIRDLVTAVNPPDGDGGYVNNARFGFAIFTKAGARLLVPVGDDTTEEIVEWVTLPDVPTAADNINGLGGNSHGLAMLEMARYLAHSPTYSPTNTFGPLPPWGFADGGYSGDIYPGSWPAVIGAADTGAFPFEEQSLPTIWDLSCRPTYLVHIDDGLWGGNDGDRFGNCSDLDGDSIAETCPLEFIGDASGDGEFWMEDISKKIFETDFAPWFTGTQNVPVHVITFDDPASAPLMQIVAEVGGGTFHYSTSGDELTDALYSVTINIFESLASFAGVAVPASRSSSGASLYNAYFEPRGNESIWAGHLEAWGLAPDGTIMDASDPPVAAIDPDTDRLTEPHNPYWDAGSVLLSNTSRSIFTTSPSTGLRVVLNTTNISESDLALAGGAPPPVPPPDPCSLVASSVPAGWDFQLISPATLPKAPPDSTVKFRYCVDATRNGAKGDTFGTYPVDGEVSDAIDIQSRKEKDGICPSYKEKDLNVGKEEQMIQVRYYQGKDTAATGWTDAICVTTSGVGVPVVSPDFAPYPNATTSGIDTYAELQTAVIDFAYGKDGFDQDDDASFTENRDVMLGDIFHSTPLVVSQPGGIHSYEPGYTAFKTAYDGRDRVVYAGANDGMLHAFHGGDFHADDPDTAGTNEGDDPATTETEYGYYDFGTGAELFAYVPGVLLPKLKYLSHNVPRTIYFADGTPAATEAWLGDGSGTDITKSADEWATVLVTGLREGGAGYVALDVTDPGAGSLDAHGPYPVLLWEFTHSKLAQSWSEPIIARVKLNGATASGDKCGRDDGDGDCREQWVAIFAGGYHPAADPNHFSYVADPDSADWSDAGKAIFMVALDSGDLIASVEFDKAGLEGPNTMKFGMPSTPAVLDLDFDGFSDVVYVGDLGGQMWKWDIQEVGLDGDADPLVDNWTAGVFFRSIPEVLDSGDSHYRSFFYPPTAAFEKGKLTVAFGSGEREELRYEGVEDEDDNNRFFVIQDLYPTGAGAFPVAKTEANLTDATLTATDENPLDSGFFFTAAEGEKFITESTVFAGFVFVASYDPNADAGDICSASGGQASLYAFDLGTGQGLFIADADSPDPEDRKESLGNGLPSSPKISIAEDPDDDVLYIKTSTGQIVAIDLDVRSDTPTADIYWRPIY
jgi:hypothetical protein